MSRSRLARNLLLITGIRLFPTGQMYCLLSCVLLRLLCKTDSSEIWNSNLKHLERFSALCFVAIVPSVQLSGTNIPSPVDNRIETAIESVVEELDIIFS